MFVCVRVCVCVCVRACVRVCVRAWVQGVVYRAVWRGLPVVAKTLNDGAAAAGAGGGLREEFLHEMSVLSHLRHPNLVAPAPPRPAPPSGADGIPRPRGRRRRICIRVESRPCLSLKPAVSESKAGRIRDETRPGPSQKPAKPESGGVLLGRCCFWGRVSRGSPCGCSPSTSTAAA